jgi:hypothetical protein
LSIFEAGATKVINLLRLNLLKEQDP